MCTAGDDRHLPGLASAEQKLVAFSNVVFGQSHKRRGAASLRGCASKTTDEWGWGLRFGGIVLRRSKQPNEKGVGCYYVLGYEFPRPGLL